MAIQSAFTLATKTHFTSKSMKSADATDDESRSALRNVALRGTMKMAGEGRTG